MTIDQSEEPIRKSKKMGLDDAVKSFLPPTVESLAIGGMHLHNTPMSIVREIIRQNIRIKRLITSPAASINADLLIGSGLVEEVVTPYIGFEHMGLAPAFRRITQEGRLKVLEVDEQTLILALRAAGSGQPFAPLPPGQGLSEVTKISPDFYRPTIDPFTGKKVLVTQPLKPQVAIFVAQQADEYGNALFKGSPFTDREMLLAAEIVILQTEEIILNPQLTRNPLLVTVPGHLVNVVVAQRFGCHPTSSHRYYNYDEDHIKEYLKLATTKEGFEEYLSKYVLDLTEEEYLKRARIISN